MADRNPAVRRYRKEVKAVAEERDYVDTAALRRRINAGRRPPPPGRPRLNDEKPKDARGTMRRIFQYFGEERKIVLLLALITMICAGCSVAAPGFQARAIDAIAGRQFTDLPVILWIMLGIFLLYGLFTILQGIISAHLSQRIVRRLRSELFYHTLHLPVRYLDTHSHGDLMSRMTNDADNISNTISDSLSSIFSSVLTLAGTVSIMLYYSWQLTLLSVSTVIGSVVITRILSTYMRKFFLRRQELLGQVNGIVEESVRGYRTIAAYDQQDRITERFNATADEMTRTGIKADILGNAMGPLMNVFNNVAFVIIAAFGGYFAIQGMISIGVISAFIVYAKQFSRPINELAQLYAQLQTAVAGAERVFSVLDEPAEDSGGGMPMPEQQHVIRFEHVGFSYVPEKQVLFDFDLSVEAGQKAALVGATGSGKTTVVNLLMRFYDADRGRILIDGVDIRDISRAQLRRNIGIVLQDSLLFSDTVRNNLKYADPLADDAAMEKAAEDCGSLEMIRHLPEGYDTVLTGTGSGISQGQRQLLSIGRAFLANPGIMILDEATSSVDTRTEKRIQDAMLRLMKDRTCLIIAHRLSTVRDADLIVVMDEGHIAETGSHEELMQRKGKYYELYMTQFEGNSI